jgi:hypothetical protein
MKLNDFLNSLPPLQRQRMLGRLEGMSMAMRVARNRAEDVGGLDANNSTNQLRENEAQTVAAMIRMLQVAFGNGTMRFDDFSDEEIDEILRIY